MLGHVSPKFLLSTSHGVRVWICMGGPLKDSTLWYDKNGFWMGLSRVGLAGNGAYGIIESSIFELYKGFV